MSLNETLIGLQLTLIVFTGIVHLLYKKWGGLTLQILQSCFVVLDLVGLIVLWAILL
jgi:hypothetical protein